jgi:hypothetical protein
VAPSLEFAAVFTLAPVAPPLDCDELDWLEGTELELEVFELLPQAANTIDVATAGTRNFIADRIR